MKMYPVVSCLALIGCSSFFGSGQAVRPTIYVAYKSAVILDYSPSMTGLNSHPIGGVHAQFINYGVNVKYVDLDSTRVIVSDTDSLRRPKNVVVIRPKKQKYDTIGWAYARYTPTFGLLFHAVASDSTLTYRPLVPQSISFIKGRYIKLPTPIKR